MARKPDTRYASTGDRGAEGMSSHTFRCTDELWDAVTTRAEERGDVVSEVIRAALIKYAGLPKSTPGVIGREG